MRPPLDGADLADTLYSLLFFVALLSEGKKGG